MKSYEHVTHASVKFVLKLLIISECFDSIIKLAHDALKELVGSSLCKYHSLIATPSKYVYRAG